MPSLSLNKHYNFSLYDNSVLGKTYKNAKLKSILDYYTALKFSDVELLNKQIYPYLPSGTNNNPLISTSENLSFLMLRLKDCYLSRKEDKDKFVYSITQHQKT
jgi:hypothetical protein